MVGLHALQHEISAYIYIYIYIYILMIGNSDYDFLIRQYLLFL